MICIKEQLPSGEEFNDLTNSVGWGTETEQVVNRIDEMKKESPNLRAYLGASVGKEAFYRKFGFEVRRDAGLGEGMVRF